MNLSSPALAVDNLVATLDRLIGKRPVALFDWPTYANAGDHFIWLGEKVILKHRLRTEVLCESSLLYIDFLALTRLPRDTVFVMHGGGNFGDLYLHHQRLREAIIAAFPDRRIVVMPQTVMFQGPDRMEYSARIASQHPDLHVMARDKQSLEMLASRMRVANHYLHIDSAFALQPIVTSLIEFFGAEPTRDELRLLRRDAEAGETPIERADSVDWSAQDDLAKFAGAVPAVATVDIAGMVFGTEFDIQSWQKLCAAVRLFGSARRIVTDRLHGHILALMMGKEHVLHDNSYGKNSAFCGAWTEGNPLLKLIESQSQLKSTGPEPGTRPPALAKVLAGGDPSRRHRLGVIVPYRNRESHLSRFLPHLISYFRRDAEGRLLDVKILLVEQDDELPFNRGSLLNAGFLAIADQVDYVCFHDVDYLPMWADYSYADQPTRIIWWGMHSRPVRLNKPSLRTVASDTGLGAVTLFPTTMFQALNGFSNRFFGWGFEDTDLAARSRLHGHSIRQRHGTFIPLDHDNAGFNDDGSKSAAWLENERIYNENRREYETRGTGGEGLSSFAGKVSPVESIRVNGLDGVDVADVMYLSVNLGASHARPNEDRRKPLRGLFSDVPPSDAEIASPVPAAAPPIGAPKTSGGRNICLSMIVKNEAPVIARCLDSVRPLIDHWIIVDTGSSDGTQSIIRETLRGVPGELHERPWVDFAHNRSEALNLAKPHGDYTLIIDADDVLELSNNFKLPALTADCYELEICYKYRRFWRPALVRNALPWRYEGVLHEFLSCGFDAKNKRMIPGNLNQKKLSRARIVMSEEGARRQVAASERFGRDAEILEAALKTETDPFLVARYRFYLAQSYLNAGEALKALAAYRERATLGFWDQEVFISLYRSANIMADLDHDADAVIQAYLRAHAVVGNRAEALHGAARFCRIRERFKEGYDFAKRALKIPPPIGGLFLEQWIYDYGALDEYAVNAYWVGRYDDCAKACRRILAGKTVPVSIRPRIQTNLDYALSKMSELPRRPK